MDFFLSFFLSFPLPSAVRRIRFHFARAGSRANGRIKFLIAGRSASGGSTGFARPPETRPGDISAKRGKNEGLENLEDFAGGCCPMHSAPRGSCEGGFAGSKFSRNVFSVDWLLWFCVESPFVDASTEQPSVSQIEKLGWMDPEVRKNMAKHSNYH